MNTKKKVIVGLYASALAIIFFVSFKLNPTQNLPSDTTFNLYQQPTEILLAQNPRLADLYVIVEALNKYKNDHHQYPISMDKGNRWSSIYLTEGEIKKDWIKGLVPKYIPQLPVDARQSHNKLEQYAYQSDGANYKLVSFYPPDCAAVYEALPKMVVTEGNKCLGYGFWTKRANWYSLLQ